MSLLEYKGPKQALMSLKYLREHDDISIDKICAGIRGEIPENITDLKIPEQFLPYVQNLRVMENYRIIVKGQSGINKKVRIEYSKKAIDINCDDADLEDSLDQKFSDIGKEIEGVVEL